MKTIKFISIQLVKLHVPDTFEYMLNRFKTDIEINAIDVLMRLHKENEEFVSSYHYKCLEIIQFRNLANITY